MTLCADTAGGLISAEDQRFADTFTDVYHQPELQVPQPIRPATAQHQGARLTPELGGAVTWLPRKLALRCQYCA